MPDEEVERTLTADQHRRLAAQLFNHVWTLLETLNGHRSRTCG